MTTDQLRTKITNRQFRISKKGKIMVWDKKNELEFSQSVLNVILQKSNAGRPVSSVVFG
jgi:hypothetical protein